MSYVGNKPAQTTIPADDSVTSAMIVDGTITSADMAVDPRNATNLNAGDVPLAQLDNVPAVDLTGLEDDIALLGFRVASNGSLAKYNLVDQTVDDFQDASGVDASSSTNEVRNAAGNYYQGLTDESLTGGTETSYEDGGTTYIVNTFLANDDLVVPATTTISALMVGGGGEGGGPDYGGGGGAGAVVHRTGYSVTAATYAMVIGSGGTGGTGNDGGDTTGFSVTATGGGGGSTSAGGDGRDGANGGGGDYKSGGGNGGTGTAPTASGWTVYAGNDGGGGYYSPSPQAIIGGGGGGATAAGGDGTSTDAGDGGAGKQIAIANTNYYWGGGGGGGVATERNAGDGGIGGGGGGGTGYASNHGSGGGSALNDGSDGNSPGFGGAAGANTGAGGGAKKADGGSGIVIVVSPQGFAAQNLTLVSTTTAAQAAPTKGDIVLTYTNGAGTTTLDTDLTAEISADGGSTWTALALGSEGSTGSHNIATSHDVTISSTITAPYNMAYRIKTLNQSASKTTRIQAVSLGWS